MISSPTFTGRWVCDDHCVMLCEKLKPMAIIGLPDLPDDARCAKAGLHLRHVNERHGDGGASADFDGGLLSAWWFFGDPAGTRCTDAPKAIKLRVATLFCLAVAIPGRL